VIAAAEKELDSYSQKRNFFVEVQLLKHFLEVGLCEIVDSVNHDDDCELILNQQRYLGQNS
jgi:hypothetical protein